MDKVIFLDIDGVLNVMMSERDGYGQLFHPHLEDNLRYIIEKTNAKIVITSTWRSDGLDVMREMWDKRNLAGEIIGITPNEYDVVSRGICEFYDLVDRGHEIQLYIDDNNVQKYCIIDDCTDFLPHQLPYYVKTSGNIEHDDCLDIGYGLTRICAERVIEILNN